MYDLFILVAATVGGIVVGSIVWVVVGAVQYFLRND